MVADLKITIRIGVSDKIGGDDLSADKIMSGNVGKHSMKNFIVGICEVRAYLTF